MKTIARNFWNLHWAFQSKVLYNWREYEANKTKLTDTQIELLFKQLTVTAKTCLDTFSPKLRAVFLNKYNILKEVYENGATLTTYI